MSRATQRLRLAVTMTGGVSLAVWMGGVAREINLLTQASDLRVRADGETAVPPPSGPQAGSLAVRVRDLYGQLLDLMDMTASVDVLSGTSAGGVNAAILGLANARRLDIGPLRELWLQAGAFDQLLRDPQADPKPSSLLQGDGQLLTALYKGLQTLAGGDDAGWSRPEEEARETTVHITTSLLHGQNGQFTDDYGNSVFNADNHGLFTFTKDQLVKREAVAALALAARSSASFPAAFEPSFVPIGSHDADGVPTDAPGPHPDMLPYADNITQSTWVADGGLLANRPLGPLLKSVLARTTDREVRRVMFFVVPNTGSPAPPAKAEFSRPYQLGESLKLDLDAMLNQSIGADLDAIVRHNDQVTSLASTRLLLARLAGNRNLADEQMWSDYRTVETAAVAAPIAETIAAHMPAFNNWRPLLSPGLAASARIRAALANAIGQGLQTPPKNLADVGTLGQPAYQSARAVVLDLIYACYHLAQDPEDVTSIANVHEKLNEFSFRSAQLTGTVMSALEDKVPGKNPDWDQALNSLAGTVLSALQKNTGSGPDELQGGWNSLLEALTRVFAVAETLTEGPTPSGSGAGAGKAALPTATAAAHGTSREGTADQRLGLAALIKDYRTFLFRLPQPEQEQPVQEQPEEAGKRQDTALPSGEGLALRLTELHAAVRSTSPIEAEAEQRLELIQASADTRTLLAPNRKSSADKLTGLQLHHFAAFYKGTWRANDFMWGRLDGTGWLVQLLLDPRRISAVVDGQPIGDRNVNGAAWFYGELCRIAGPPGSEAKALGIDEESLRRDLAFLDHPDEPVPASLPDVALWVALTLQRFIAAEELTAVAAQIRNPANGSPGGPALGWLEVFDTALTGKPPVDLAGGILDAQNIWEHLVAAKVPPQKRINTFLGSLETLLGKAPDGIRTQLTRELSFLKEADAPIAASLNVLQDWAGNRLAAAAQARTERPLLDETWVGRVADTLSSCPVPDERLSDEVGTPLFTRTVTQALAVATAAGTATTGKPPATLAPTFSTARTVTTAAYLITKRTGGGARTLIWLGLLGLGLGIASMFVKVPIVGTAGLAILFTGAILLGIGLWRRSIYVAGFVVAVAIALIAAAPWLPYIHGHLISWLKITAVPFLDQHAWAWTAIFLLVLMPPLWMLAGEFTRRRQRRKQAEWIKLAASARASDQPSMSESAHGSPATTDFAPTVDEPTPTSGSVSMST